MKFYKLKKNITLIKVMLIALLVFSVSVCYACSSNANTENSNNTNNTSTNNKLVTNNQEKKTVLSLFLWVSNRVVINSWKNIYVNK